jgi:predicted  nucleic acid-binding Zn-ribbon protein
MKGHCLRCGDVKEINDKKICHGCVHLHDGRFDGENYS